MLTARGMVGAWSQTCAPVRQDGRLHIVPSRAADPPIARRPLAMARVSRQIGVDAPLAGAATSVQRQSVMMAALPTATALGQTSASAWRAGEVVAAMCPSAPPAAMAVANALPRGCANATRRGGASTAQAAAALACPTERL